jgi:hypothetical protein
MSRPESGAPHYASWPCRLYCERHLQPGGSLEQVAVDLAGLLADRLDRPPLTWHVGAFPAHELAEGTAGVEDLRIGRQRGVPAIIANHPTEWDLFLAAQESLVDQVQYLDITLPGPLEEQWASVVPMMELVRDVATGFGATVAYTEDAALQRAYLRDRPERLARAQMQRAGVEPAPHAIAAPLTPGGGTGLGALPELRHNVEIDHDAVPPAVYWINWWSATQVGTLGAEVVRSAGWAHVLEADDGSMTLAAADHPPDLGDAGQVARLAALVQALSLRAAQDAHTTDRAL